jgi:DNA repair protein RecN (Recombination protein N)
VQAGYRELLSLESELRRLQGDERERARMLDLYRYQAEEISAAKLVPGEEEELEEDKNRLANAEKLYSAAASAYELLSDQPGDTSAVDMLGRSVLELESIAPLDAGLAPLLESMQSALYAVEEGVRELRSYRDAVEFNPERLESVEERLDLLRNLKRKYGDSIEDVLSYGGDLESRVTALENSEERTSELNSAIEKQRRETMAHAEELSSVRRKGAENFAKKVQEELSGLNMPSAIFLVRQEPKPLDGDGIDGVEFLISANQGEPPRPLAKIASGGEMSRVMLAIKSATSAADRIPTLVFDEIDVGVGGRTAEVIADKLSLLAKKSQVLCITHLPQIASRPGNHYSIEKQLHNGRTVVRVRCLSEDERVEEIARMLGGAKTTETALRHAREMLSAE